MLREPLLDLLVLVRRVVVDDEMDFEALYRSGKCSGGASVAGQDREFDVERA